MEKIARQSPDSFTFPSLPEQNPLMAKATIIDRTSAPTTSPSGSQQQQPPSAPEPLKPPPPRRKKVPFEKGFSQMDWIKLTKDKSKDLNGLAGAPLRKDIPLSEVKLHSTADDAWTVIHNKVYNMTPYLSFHPGGVDYLMKVAGKDGTALFNKYHPWVNVDFMLQRCMIGHLDSNNNNNNNSSSSSSNNNNGEKKDMMGGGKIAAASRPIDIDMTSSRDGDDDKTTSSPPFGPTTLSSPPPLTMSKGSSLDRANAELIAKGVMEIISRSETPEDDIK